MRVPLFFVSIKLLWASIISSSIFLFILYQYSRLSIAKPIILSEGYMIYSCFCTHIRVIVRHSLTFLFLLGALTEIFLCSILITEIFHTFSLEILYNIIINNFQKNFLNIIKVLSVLTGIDYRLFFALDKFKWAPWF